MRVLQINSHYNFGSTGRIVKDIHEKLISNNHDSFVIYGRGLSFNHRNIHKINSKLDTILNVLLTRIFDRHGLGLKRVTNKIIKKIVNIKPDIIHLHNIHGYYINYEILFSYIKKSDVNVIWTLHDCWALTGHCSHFTFVECEKWKKQCNKCPQKKTYPKSIFFDASKENYINKKAYFTGIEKMSIITPSRWLKEIISFSYLNIYNSEVINNGVDLNIFKPTYGKFKLNYKINKKFIILGVASIWNNRKGLKYFLELSEIIDNDSLIIMVGLNNKQIKELPYNILGIKRTENLTQLAEIYSLSDVFLNPTLEDNFPTTNLEAISCGTPVVTFNTGGSIEPINSTTGIVCESKNVFSIKSAIDKIKENKIDRKIIRNFAINNFDKSVNYNLYLEKYCKILD